MQLISADIGRNESKFFTSNNRKVKFRSTVGEWHQRNLNSNGDYDVMIDGESYFIGELALKESYLPREMTTESKIHEETKLLFLTGIALLAHDNDIIVSTGLPIDQFNPKIKNDLVNLLQGRHSVTFKDKETKTFFINQIIACPEGGGVYWYEINNKPTLKYGKKRVVDIGSRTINYCTIEDGSYINKDSGTLNYGAIKLKNSKTNPQEFARKIVADLSSKWMDYDEDNDTIILSGGGAILLKELLKSHFKNTIVSDDPIFANVYGFYYIGLAKYGKQMTAK